MKNIILVDRNDKVIGYGEKMAVHRKGLLHRAFSLFVVNNRNELLLQKRADSKYHSGGLWANTCCSHPLRGQDLRVAIHFRLREEMGFDCDLEPIFSFIYKAKLDSQLTEYEYDHVFLGRYDGQPKPNPDEVGDWKWIKIDTLNEDLRKNPEIYAYWLWHAFPQFYENYQTAYSTGEFV